MLKEGLRPDLAHLTLQAVTSIDSLKVDAHAGDSANRSGAVHRHAIREDLRKAIGTGWIRELVVRSDTSPDLIAEVVTVAQETGRRVRLLWPDGYDGSAGGDPYKERRVARAWQARAKRVLDIAIAGSALVILSPVLLLIALLIKSTSPGPVFYRWRVVGEFGRPFVGYKFRTMVQDAEDRRRELMDRNEMIGPVFKMTNDPRITPLGRWLRKYSLDELPQLWSVLKGDMSVVGPRPVFPAEYAKYELRQMRKLSVIPGITCLWQVSGRNEIRDLADWVRMDLEYIDNWSIWLDLKILARTVVAVLKGTGR